MKYICVNLKRRPDRKLQMETQFKKNNINNYTFFEAVDGNTLTNNHKDISLFQGNDFNYLTGVIGCALSHIYLWRQLVRDKSNNAYIILEDDATFVDDYQRKFNGIKTKIVEDMDFIFLGYHSAINSQTKHNPYIKKLDAKAYLGGTFAYIVNKNGAQKLINYINHHGVKRAIDGVIYDSNINLYEASPFLITSEGVQYSSNKNVDSDIQRSQQRLDMSKKSNYNKWIFFLIIITVVVIISLSFYCCYRWL